MSKYSVTCMIATHVITRKFVFEEWYLLHSHRREDLKSYKFVFDVSVCSFCMRNLYIYIYIYIYMGVCIIHMRFNRA
jgi:hypothetical protein